MTTPQIADAHSTILDRLDLLSRQARLAAQVRPLLLDIAARVGSVVHDDDDILTITSMIGIAIQARR